MQLEFENLNVADSMELKIIYHLHVPALHIAAIKNIIGADKYSMKNH